MTMELLDYTAKGISAVLVALSDSTVHMYQDKHLVDVIQTPDVINALKFGRFGREEGNLILTTRGKHEILLILLQWTNMAASFHLVHRLDVFGYGKFWELQGLPIKNGKHSLANL